MSSTGRKPLLVALVVSVALHALCSWRFSRTLRPLPPGLQGETIELSIDAAAPAPARVASETLRVPAVEPRGAPRWSKPAPQTAAAASSRAPVSAGVAASPGAENAGSVVQTGNVDLSPRAVALRARDGLGPPQAACDPLTQPAERMRCAPASDRPSSLTQLQRALNAAAREIPHLARTAPPPLHHESDGSYSYRDHVFSARIERDGRVSFSDNGPSLGLGPGKLIFGFDLTDIIERQLLNRELYPTQKRDFLERTAALRMELANKYLAAELRRAGHDLRDELERIIGDRHSSTRQKHAQVFALWDDCADDDIGRQGQQVVEEFVRERMPRGSQLAFDELELAALNQTRSARSPFRPYG